MKKVQTLTLALALVALGSVSWAATSLNSSRIMQKGSPETTASNLNLSKSNINRLTGKVTQVDEKDKTFAVAVTCSAKTMKGDFSRDTFKVGNTIDITYTQTPGGPMEATTIKSSKSNGSERLVGGDYGREHWVTGKVTEVNNRAKTYTIAVVFSAAKLSKLPAVGQIVDITYTETPGGGPLEASNLNLSKSNIN